MSYPKDENTFRKRVKDQLKQVQENTNQLKGIISNGRTKFRLKHWMQEEKNEGQEFASPSN